MTAPQLIRITNANRQRFYDLFVLRPFDASAKECTWLNSKDDAAIQNSRIEQFLADESANLLHATQYNAGNGYLYSHDGAAPQPLSPVGKADAGYSDFIKQLRKMISVEVHDNGKSIFVEMDPLPVGDEIAILYQTSPSSAWEVATAKTIEKTAYVDQLIAPYSNVTGLPMQLGITKFVDGTKLLNRFYAGEDDHGPCITAATLHRIDPHGVAHTELTNEDFMLNQFVHKEDWLALQEKLYGAFVSFEAVTSSTQCEEFLRGKGQFSISKTGMKDAAGKPISDKKEKPVINGRFLQQDKDGKPVIQDINASVLEELMYRLFGMQPPQRPLAIEAPDTTGLSTNNPTNPQKYWVGRNVQKVSKIIKNHQEVLKVDLDDHSYLIDEGNKLTLHGTVREDYLKAMILHAKHNWGGTFKIDSASDSERDTLITLAAQHDVRIIGLPRSQPTRPAANRSALTPAAAVHAV